MLSVPQRIVTYNLMTFKKLIYFGFFALFALCSCNTLSSRSGDKQKAELHAQIGVGYLSAGNYPAALESLTTAEALDPKSAAIQNNLGLAYYVRKRFPEAQQHLQQAISLAPDFSEAKNNLARVHLERGQYAAALSLLKEVSRDLKYPNQEKVSFHYGLYHFKLKEFEKAQAYFLKSIRESKEYCAGHSYYGMSLYHRGMYSEASEALDQAEAICGKLSDEPQFLSAQSYLKLDQKEKARARFEDLIRNDPGSPLSEKARQILKTLKVEE